MAEQTTSQTQQIKDGFKKAMDDHATRVESAFSEMAKLEEKGLEQAVRPARRGHSPHEGEPRLRQRARRPVAQAHGRRRPPDGRDGRGREPLNGPGRAHPEGRPLARRERIAVSLPPAFQREAGGGAPRAGRTLDDQQVVRRRPAQPARASSRLSSPGGLDVYCLDWGTAQDEDRYLTWDDVLARLGRAVRFTARARGAQERRPARLLHGRHARGHLHGPRAEARRGAHQPRGPVRLLARRAAAHHGRPEVVRCDGHRRRRATSSPNQMQSGFVALRPERRGGQVGRLLRPHARARLARRRSTRSRHWAGDNIPFPGSAYETYIERALPEQRAGEGRAPRGRQARGPRRASAARCSPSRPSATPSARCPPRGR